MALGSRVSFEPLRDIAEGAIGADFVAVGTPLAHSSVILTITNTTDVFITVSFDGVTEHAGIPSDTIRTWNFSSNTNATSFQLLMAQGTTVYVRGAPTVGAVYVETCYSS